MRVRAAAQERQDTVERQYPLVSVELPMRRGEGLSPRHVARCTVLSRLTPSEQGGEFQGSEGTIPLLSAAQRGNLVEWGCLTS